MFLLISYLGAAVSVVWLADKVVRLLLTSSGGGDAALTQLPLVHFAGEFAREEPVVTLVFAGTSLGLIAKYLAGWVGLPNYFLEDINLLCLAFFWIAFRLRGLGRTNRRSENQE